MSVIAFLFGFSCAGGERLQDGSWVGDEGEREEEAGNDANKE